MRTTTLTTTLPDLVLIEPNPAKHASITLSWFTADYGHETLLLMGNAEHEIGTPSLESELHILKEFIDLNTRGVQLTWMLQFGDTIVGVAWIELQENHGVQPPSVHLMIGDKNYRGKGIGKATMQTLVRYAKDTLGATVIYSRHLTRNTVIANLNHGLGFTLDGNPYADTNMLEWQNTKLSL